jgi:hypothetical protein
MTTRATDGSSVALSDYAFDFIPPGAAACDE